MNYIKKMGKRNILFFSMGIITLCLFIYRSQVVQEVTATQTTFDTNVETPKDVDESNDDIGAMYVDIKGAVKLPGMYEVSSDMRLLNVIDLAGGLSEEADSQRVNFSQKVEDQMVIYVPRVGEEAEEVQLIQGQGASKDESESKVNINQATKEELMTLNGVGEKKAEKIIDYREEHGSFQKIEELKNVNGFGEKSFESLEKYIRIA